MTGETTTPAIAPNDLAFFADLLRRHSAISVGPDKEYLVQARLAPIVKDLQLVDTRALIEQLRRPVVAPDLLERVIDAMTTNETSFFRDHRPFDTLRLHVLPEVIERNRAQRRLRIWSAASSTGQELYSIAMLLDEHFPELADWDVVLHGTDLSAEVVERARAGRYSALEVNRGLPATHLVRYFTRDGAAHVLSERLRRRCRFERMNLARDFPLLPGFDVVLCRNVLIYFEQDVRDAILHRIERTLVPGGHLFLGTAETVTGPTSLTATTVNATLVYRTPDGTTQLTRTKDIA